MLWEKVVLKLSHRHMPPQGLPRPDEATYNAVVGALVKELDEAAAGSPNPGPSPTFRRLTRAEYHNVIRDLLALDIDVSSLLPADESSQGFDNITVQNLSPRVARTILSAVAEDQPPGSWQSRKVSDGRYDSASHQTLLRNTGSVAYRSERGAER